AASKPKDSKIANGDGGDDDADIGSGYDFDLAYAISGHKAQGSEWPLVIVLIDDSAAANRVCSREWWYTSISRATKLCILIGDLSVLEKHWRTQETPRRKTFLTELLTGAL